MMRKGLSDAKAEGRSVTRADSKSAPAVDGGVLLSKGGGIHA